MVLFFCPVCRQWQFDQEKIVVIDICKSCRKMAEEALKKGEEDVAAKNCVPGVKAEEVAAAYLNWID